MDNDRLGPSLLQAMTAMGHTRAFRKDAILIQEGDHSSTLYIVLTGRVLAYASSEEGRDVVLSDYGPGEYFGELALDGGPRAASVRAAEPTTCCVSRTRTVRTPSASSDSSASRRARRP